MVSRKELVDISGQGLCGGWKARNSRKRSRRSPEALTAGGPTLRGWHDLLNVRPKRGELTSGVNFRVLTVAAEQTIAAPAERMTARLIRELANEALASRTRLIELDRELEALLQRHPNAALIRSLPGMGAVLTAELIAEAGNLARFRSADALASAAGMAPVLRQSGRTRFLRRPSGGNKGLKRVFYQSAFCSLNHDDSRAFYERKRREGKRHHQAVIASHEDA